MPSPSEPSDPSASLPNVPSDLSDRLRQEHGEEADPRVTLTGASGEPRGGPTSTPPRSASDARYTFEGEIARGGMGAVLGVYDQDLRRKLAMKVILTQEDGSVPQGTLGRFLEEAQVTAQLDHPGVVPIHELGLDGAGQVYFTMKLVKGQDLKAVLEKVRSGEEGWNTTRVLNVLLRACEAMAFAHSKGVIHRDLKPANIMVGRFGEVYVMDWGIARVLGQPDRKDLRIREDLPQTSVVHSDRKEGSATDDSPDAPLLTMDGDVVGTPAYMPLEQAEGRLKDIGTRSDVYSLGAILYELLAGQMPYIRPGARVSPRTLLGMVVDRPPKPIEELASEAPPELLAICSKAMAREKGDRYGSTVELAEDLRAFLEQRVVKAYRTGAVVELRKWVERNKGLAASLLVGVILLLAAGASGSVAVATQEKNAQLDSANSELESSNEALQASESALSSANQELNEKNSALEESQEELAETNADLATANAELDSRNRLLSDLEILQDLQDRQERLWPARPRLLDAMSTWITTAESLLERLPRHAQELASLREEAAAVTEDALAEALSRSPRLQAYEDAAVVMSTLEAQLAELPEDAMPAAIPEEESGDETQQSTSGADDEAPPNQPTPAETRASLAAQRSSLIALRNEIEEVARATVQWRFPEDPEKQWRHDNLAALVESARALAAPETGLLASVWGRKKRASTIEDETIGDEFDDWLEAMDAIAASEKYGGWELPHEQVGLIPLGPDPHSGLWEFWHVESGGRPQWSPEEGVAPTEDMGLVLVLIPGGTYRMGASLDPASPHHDPAARPEEGPVHEVTLGPYFLSKYELTQGQWFRLTDARPSQFAAGEHWSGNELLDTNPVTNVSWQDAQRVLPRFGLRLPTEAQWECACRAGSASPWWCGGRASIADSERIAGNIIDQGAMDRGAPVSWGVPEPWDDGHVVHAPVGSYRANGFGLHDMLGNVWELCEEEYVQSAYQLPVNPQDGHRLLLGNRADGPGSRVNRGGSFVYPAFSARSANRGHHSPSSQSNNLGLRPAQGIMPD